LVKQLKNRYNDPTTNKRFIIGVDRAKIGALVQSGLVNDKLEIIPITRVIDKLVLVKQDTELWDKLICKIPLVRAIYSATKQTMESLFSKKDNFKKTVLVEFPRKNTLSIAFVANEIKIGDKDYYVVYVPTAPNPTSGYTIFVKKDEVVHVDLTVDEAMKIILSGGLVMKNEIKLS